jgi:hypothetical protein
MRRALFVGVGLFCLALAGCTVLKGIGDVLTGGGADGGGGVAAAVATVNPLWGGILGVVGLGLTALGESKKKEEGR